MADERKVFDVGRPTSSPTSRPIISSGPPAPDPMVKSAVKIPVSLDGEPPAPSRPAETAEAKLPAEVIPEQQDIPVSAPPESQVIDETAPAVQITNSAITPALPGAPANDLTVPRFGELQSKIDSHPLFSGQKEERIKIRRLPGFVKPLGALVVVLIIAYLVVDAGVVRGASHLPYHIFKQPTSISTAPVITVPDTTASAAEQPSTPTVSKFSVWRDYNSADFGYSFSYPSGYGTFSAGQTAGNDIADTMTSGVPKVGLAHVNGALKITDYESLSAAIPTYKNGPTIELEKGQWVVVKADSADANKYKVGDVFKDISLVKNSQQQDIYTLTDDDNGSSAYIILFASKDSFHSVTLPQFTVQDTGSSAVNDKSSYDAMFRQLRSSIKA